MGFSSPYPHTRILKINCEAVRKLISAEKLRVFFFLAHPGVRMDIPAPVKSNAVVHTCASSIHPNGASAPSTQLTSVTAIIKGVGNRV